ncbi:MAG TPA: adenylate/guanylate cyclase domain-containing protein, partial [Myxococcales bacterium]|nr:adenylate/guanylate cyclase domain-containing protein [Myxococcales bacterium]
MKSRNLAVLFAGLCGASERQTWEESQRTLRLHEAVVGPALRKFRGRRIKQIGATFLYTFRSPTDAVLAA